MDKQTAIDLLDNLLGMVEDNHESDYDTAIKMGIDALKEKTQLSKEDATKGTTFDCISRQAAIGAAIDAADDWDGGYNLSRADMIEKAINNLPPAQAEIITCIDCIHYTPLGKDKAWGRCSVHSSPTENQRMCQSCDFCSWAERRTDG